MTVMDLKMLEIKVRFTPTDLERITAEAASIGISRSELIRRRALVTDCQQGGAALDTMAYHRLVAGATRHIAGHLPRHLVEQIVIYVITRLTTPHQPQANPGLESAA